MGSVVLVLALCSSFISKLNGQPQGYQAKGQQEPRGIMDEALKKFYFDLYDGADPEDEDAAGVGGGNHDSHSFNIDDYFDTQDSGMNKKQDKIEPPRYPDNRSAKISNKFITPPLRALPSPPPLPSSPLQSPAAAPAQASSSDPTFVLSRLLFHLSQLPPQ